MGKKKKIVRVGGWKHVGNDNLNDKDDREGAFDRKWIFEMHCHRT